MDGLQWNTLLKWMIWGYPYFWKHPYEFAIRFFGDFRCFTKGEASSQLPGDCALCPLWHGEWKHDPNWKVAGDFQRLGIKRWKNWMTWHTQVLISDMFFVGHILPKQPERYKNHTDNSFSNLPPSFFFKHVRWLGILKFSNDTPRHMFHSPWPDLRKKKTQEGTSLTSLQCRPCESGSFRQTDPWILRHLTSPRISGT